MTFLKFSCRKGKLLDKKTIIPLVVIWGLYEISQYCFILVLPLLVFSFIRENKFPQSTLLIAERDSFSLEIALSIPYAMVEGFDGYRRVYPDILLS